MFREGLERLAHGLESHARLSTFGRLGRARHRAALGRITFQGRTDVRGAPPRSARNPSARPVFIVGMPRSGTTILHALLHLDRDHRAPLSWECLLPDPAPSPDDYQGQRADRDRAQGVRPDLPARAGLQAQALHDGGLTAGVRRHHGPQLRQLPVHGHGPGCRSTTTGSPAPTRQRTCGGTGGSCSSSSRAAFRAAAGC